MAVAGLVVAGYTLGQAVTGRVRGRLADRHGLVTVAACCGAGYALALLALLAGTITGAPAGLLTGAATAAGLVNPPLSPGMRSLWSVRAGTRFAQPAFALDAALMNLGYITGPVLHRMLGITYKSAWFMAHRIREAMRELHPEPMGGSGKIVEADETYTSAAKRRTSIAASAPPAISAAAVRRSPSPWWSAADAFARTMYRL